MRQDWNGGAEVAPPDVDRSEPVVDVAQVRGSLPRWIYRQPCRRGAGGYTRGGAKADFVADSEADSGMPMAFRGVRGRPTAVPEVTNDGCRHCESSAELPFTGHAESYPVNHHSL